MYRGRLACRAAPHGIAVGGAGRTTKSDRAEVANCIMQMAAKPPYGTRTRRQLRALVAFIPRVLLFRRCLPPASPTWLPTPVRPGSRWRFRASLPTCWMSRRSRWISTPSIGGHPTLRASPGATSRDGWTVRPFARPRPCPRRQPRCEGRLRDAARPCAPSSATRRRPTHDPFPADHRNATGLGWAKRASASVATSKPDARPSPAIST